MNISSAADLYVNCDLDNNSSFGKIRFGANDVGPYSTELMRIQENGRVGIGTASPGELLDVDGNVAADTLKATVVKISNWTIEAPDYVFTEDYRLPTLGEVDSFIKENRHLPDVPSASDMKREGVDLAEMNMLLLKKVEELTLHAIEQDKRIRKLEMRE